MTRRGHPFSRMRLRAEELIQSVSLKSSVTGVVILTISLAFFITYVKWIYPISTQIDPEAAATTSSAPIAIGSNSPIVLSAGGIGLAPGPSLHPVASPADVRATE